jgi:hypothetical protein
MKFRSDNLNIFNGAKFAILTQNAQVEFLSEHELSTELNAMQALSVFNNPKKHSIGFQMYKTDDFICTKQTIPNEQNRRFQMYKIDDYIIWKLLKALSSIPLLDIWMDRISHDSLLYLYYFFVLCNQQSLIFDHMRYRTLKINFTQDDYIIWKLLKALSSIPLLDIWMDRIIQVCYQDGFFICWEIPIFSEVSRQSLKH